MDIRKWRCLLIAAAAAGSLFAGPCGITTLQLRDFLTTTVIRTGVTTVASIVEAAVIEQAGTQDE